ncbi:hypothetical protein EDB81DRAFT_754075 [Dactylonectria macrodidyma]|uniref:Uncharacterized protein n=1 Tax=Dactylonectria macrodidyma TaxID=307937 RepID=A0A9P9FJG7_9HYPO|nr:hypothetical protein EDB81DRAFT_754075 [Dactylonectria macrodidyma]
MLLPDKWKFASLALSSAILVILKLLLTLMTTVSLPPFRGGSNFSDIFASANEGDRVRFPDGGLHEEVRQEDRPRHRTGVDGDHPYRPGLIAMWISLVAMVWMLDPNRVEFNLHVEHTGLMPSLSSILAEALHLPLI